MRIDSQINRSDMANRAALPESVRKSNSSGCANVTNSEEDTISSLSSSLLESTSIREDRVTALQQQIQSGTYRIDHAALADAMICAFSGQAAS